MAEAELDPWRDAFEVPDADELSDVTRGSVRARSAARTCRATLASAVGNAARAAATSRSATTRLTCTPRRAAKSRNRSTPSRASRAGSANCAATSRPTLVPSTSLTARLRPGNARSSWPSNWFFVRPARPRPQSTAGDSARPPPPDPHQLHLGRQRRGPAPRSAIAGHRELHRGHQHPAGEIRPSPSPSPCPHRPAPPPTAAAEPLPSSPSRTSTAQQSPRDTSGGTSHRAHARPPILSTPLWQLISQPRRSHAGVISAGRVTHVTRLIRNGTPEPDTEPRHRLDIGSASTVRLGPAVGGVGRRSQFGAQDMRRDQQVARPTRRAAAIHPVSRSASASNRSPNGWNPICRL